MKTLLCYVLLLCSVASTLQAHPKLPAIFGDHMVLQRDAPVKIWGWADPGEILSIALGEERVAVETGEDGKWMVELKPRPASAEGVNLMVMGAQGRLERVNILFGDVWLCSGQSNMEWSVRTSNVSEGAVKDDFKNVRLFKVDWQAVDSPQEDLSGQWSSAQGESIQRFSATAYAFGRKLHRELDIPIGLINSSWGGTSAEAWTPFEKMEGKGSMQVYLDERAQRIKQWDGKKAKEQYQANFERWKKRVLAVREANAALAEGEKKAALPRAPKPPVHPIRDKNYPANLYHAMIHPLMPLSIKGALWYQGESNRKAAANYKVLLPTMIDAWREGFGQEFPFYIVQLANYLEVSEDANAVSQWAELQAAQRHVALNHPKTGMVVINEIGEADDIHPRKKLEVGERLARMSLIRDYGKRGIESGPVLKKAEFLDGKVTLSYSQVGKGLGIREGSGTELGGYAIAGADGVYQWAKATIVGKDQVEVALKGVGPMKLRYAWQDNPQRANLVNSEGLPASVFEEVK